MKKYLIILIPLLFFVYSHKAEAITASSSIIYELNASATASNVNGGGFNPTNANMLTDLAATSATGNAPVLTSTSYTFVAGDVGHWVYIKSGTNWTAGWYVISSVDAGAATVNATIGTAVQVDTTQGHPSPRYKANTVAGVATVASPSSGTFTMDYSQGTAAIDSGTDLASADGDLNPAVITSATHNFTSQEVGNLIHITAGTGWTAGWYEIVSVSGNAATVDGAVGTDGAKTGGTWYLGGAMSLNSTLDDDLFELGRGLNGTGGARFFIKNGTFSLGETVTIAASGGSQAPISIEGYNSLRGDTPTGTNRPTINTGANSVTLGANWDGYNFIISGSATSLLTTGTNSKLVNIKSTNLTTTTTRAAFALTGSGSFAFNVEGVSYRGRGVSINSHATIIGSYFHDSDVGIYAGSNGHAFIMNTISASNVSNGINIATAQTAKFILNNVTLYGSENTTGTGLGIVTGSTGGIRMMNSIIYGFATGISHADTQTVGFSAYNDFFNNDTDVTNWQKGSNDIAVNPTFTNVTQVTGTAGAFVAGGSKLVDTSKNFTTLGVAAGNVVYISAGTGITAGQYLIDSITTTTNPNDTLNITVPASPGTNTTADKVYQITLGYNFAVGTDLKAVGFPGVFQGGLTTGYMDIGAVQRMEGAGNPGSTQFRGGVKVR